jgi:hypothetical protein
VAGDQLYVDAPLAFNDTLPPLQIPGAAGVTVMFGRALTVTVTLLLQPLLFV